MGSFAGKCEIVEESEDQQRSAIYSGRTIWPPLGLSIVDNKDLERPVLKLGYKGSLEDDINQLFESISIRTSGMAPSYDVGPSMSRNTSPLGRNDLKRPVNPGAQRSPVAAPAESAMLKQALRDLCISKASETAAMKRVPKTSGSQGSSEAGRLKHLYGSVLVDSGSGTRLANEEGKAVLVELLGEGKTSSPESISQQLRALKISSSSQSAPMSPQYPVQTNRCNDGTVLRQHGVDSVSRSAGYQESNTDILRNDDGLYAYLESRLNAEDEALGLDRNLPSSSRSGSEIVVGLKSVRRVRLLYANTPTATIVNGRRVAKLTRTVPRPVKPALRNKPSVKKKVKQFASPANVYDEVDGFYDPITKQLLCHRCHSALKNPATGEACEDSHVSSNNIIAHIDEVGSDDLNPGMKYPGSEETAQDLCCLGYETSNAVSTGIKNDQATVRRSHEVNTNMITSSAETNHPVSLASAFVNNDTVVDPVSFRCGPKNAYKVSEEISLSVPSGKEVDQQDTLFMSDQNVEIGSFSERSVVMNPDSPPNEPNIDGTIIEEGKENQTNKGINGEFSQSSNDIIRGNSTSTSMSEEEEESNASRSSFGNRPHMLKDMRWEAIQHIRMQHGSIGLRHFNLLKKLGCGDIGTVYLAELTGTNCMFAIKVMDNEFLARRNKMPRAQTERDILRMLDHPFLPTLYSHFTSDNLSCLVMECCPGGDLHVLRQKQPGRCFPEPAARFYVAEVLLALEYLHMLGVIYRDLKPENILVREDGHIMVTDFDLSLRCSVSPTLLSSSSPLHADSVRHSGQSNCIEPWCIQPSLRVSCFRPRLLLSTKKGKTKRMRKLRKSDLIARFRSLPQLVAEPTDARSNSFVGTHEYLAPEIIKGAGHGAAVDWWTFGIFLYELLYGRTPFKGSTNEETLGNVVLQNLKFPDNQNVSFQARDLIRGLLVKEPENRLGTEKGAAEIKRHPFFEGLNWALIRCAIPPELPELYEYGPSNHESKGNYLECKAIGEHLEFELF